MRWKVCIGLLAAIIAVGALANEAAGQEPEDDWHCPYTNLATFPPGFVGEFPGNGALSQDWEVDPVYFVTQVCYRTVSGLHYVDIEPAHSGTILSPEPILGFSLNKTTQPPMTTTSTTTPDTTTTTEPEGTTTTTEPNGSTTTTEPEGSTSTTGPPVTPTTAPTTSPPSDETCRGVVINGECTTPNTGASTDPIIWLFAAIVASAIGFGLYKLANWGLDQLAARKV